MEKERIDEEFGHQPEPAQSTITPTPVEAVALLDANDKVKPTQVKHERPFSNKPLPRAALIGVSSMVGLLLIFGFIGGRGGSAPHSQATTDSANPQATSPTQAEIDRLRDENAKMKRSMAIDKQQLQFDKQQFSRQTPHPPVTKVAQQVAPTSPMPVRQVEYVTAPRTFTPPEPYQPTRPVADSLSPSLAAAKPSPLPVKEDPYKQLEKIQKIASMSNFGSDMSSGDDSQETRQPLPTGSNLAPKPRGGIGLPPTEASQTSGSDQLTEEQTNSYQPTSYRTGYSSDPSSEVQVGTMVEGMLDTPLAWSGNTRSSATANVRIEILEPLKTANGQIALPSGSHLIAQVVDADNAGLLQLSVVAVQMSQNGRLVENPLPTGVLQIFGKGGRPLQAKYHGPKRGNSFFSSLGSMAGVAGGIATNSPASIYATDVLQQLNRPSYQSQPTYFTLERGTKLEVYVNQSFNL